MSVSINPTPKWPFPTRTPCMVQVPAHLLRTCTATPNPSPVDAWLQLGAARMADYPADVVAVAIPCSPQVAHEMLVFMQQHWDFPNLSWAELDLLAQIINVAGGAPQMIKRLKEQPLVRTDRAGDQMGAVVYYDTDWEEYRVVPTVNGFEQSPKTHYHTDDKDDAYTTAAHMIVEASKL